MEGFVNKNDAPAIFAGASFMIFNIKRRLGLV